MSFCASPSPAKAKRSPRCRKCGSINCRLKITRPPSTPSMSSPPPKNPKSKIAPSSCRRLSPLPIEAVCRGYLVGSGWKDYQQTGAVCGIELPPGLRLAARFDSPLYTPATKAEQGAHDENISQSRVAPNHRRGSRRQSPRRRLASLRIGRAIRRRTRRDSRRHQIRIRARRRRADFDRRSAYSRFVEILARRRIPRRRKSAQFR